MSANSVRLVGLDKDSNEIFEVSLLNDDEFGEAMLKLFNKAFEKEVGPLVNAKWVCGQPGKDIVVVWGATSNKGMHDRYLDVSYSDQRTW